MTSSRILAASAIATMAVAQAAHAQGPDLQRLHDDLHLTAAQQPAWNAFARASVPDPNQQARERSAEQMMSTLTSPKRVQLSIAVMEADLQTLKERGQALNALYSTLTPDQRMVFDRDTLPSQGGEQQP